LETIRNTRLGCAYLSSHGSTAALNAAPKGKAHLNTEIPMTDINTMLASLRRPSLLIRAARFGLTDYNRTRDLKRVMGTSQGLTPTRVLDGLIEKEARFEETRKKGDAAYSVTRHIEVLIALMAEARLLPRGPHAI
jgi:hypothetical protein